LEAGGFTVSITGRPYYSVAFDEVHEMCIYKDMKRAVIHPTPSYLQKTFLFLNYRIKAFTNLMQVLFPERHEKLFTSTIANVNSSIKQIEENVQKLCFEINTNKLMSIQEVNKELLNVFNGQVATPEQTINMLSLDSRHSDSMSIQGYCKHRGL